MAALTNIGLQLTDNDNVATVFLEAEAGQIHAGDTVVVRNARGEETEIAVSNHIPYGHKIAVRPIAAGDDVIKYGEVIGRATRAIATGEHVHVHNMESCRGRGDVAAAEGRA